MLVKDESDGNVISLVINKCIWQNKIFIRLWCWRESQVIIIGPSVQNLIAICLIFLDDISVWPKWWTNRPAMPRATPLAKLKVEDDWDQAKHVKSF